MVVLLSITSAVRLWIVVNVLRSESVRRMRIAVESIAASVADLECLILMLSLRKQGIVQHLENASVLLLLVKSGLTFFHKCT